MNNTTFPELAALRIEMSEEVRDEQFRAIVAHLNEPVQESLGLVTKARAAWRRWVVVVAAVGTALVPVAAVASEAAAPGDLLYPVKLTVERIQLIFNDDAAAEHRVDELETLVDRSVDAVVIDRHLTTTLDAIEGTTDRTDLITRVSDAVIRYQETDRIREGIVDSVITDDRPAVSDSDGATTTAPTTSTVADKDGRDSETDRAPTTTQPAETTTTTVRHSDSDDAVVGSDGDAVGDDDRQP